MKEVKCEHCQEWTDGSKGHCLHCGQRLRDAHLKDLEERANYDLKGMPFVKIDKNDPFFKRAFYAVIFFFQLIFASLISVVAAIASSTVH